jgi:predicted amidophosphoribosyltransferase
VSDQVADLHIGIIDDVLTTGATSVEFARELLDSGASAVSLWVIARTAAA